MLEIRNEDHVNFILVFKLDLQYPVGNFNSSRHDVSSDIIVGNIGVITFGIRFDERTKNF